MSVRVHIFISGLVQGVTFRIFTREQAKNLGVTGWVKNLRDGRVEFILEGEQKLVETLVEKIKAGPRWARVQDVEINYEEYKGEFKNFEIRF